MIIKVITLVKCSCVNGNSKLYRNTKTQRYSYSPPSHAHVRTHTCTHIHCLIPFITASLQPLPPPSAVLFPSLSETLYPCGSKDTARLWAGLQQKKALHTDFGFLLPWRGYKSQSLVHWKLLLDYLCPCAAELSRLNQANLDTTSMRERKELNVYSCFHHVHKYIDNSECLPPHPVFPLPAFVSHIPNEEQDHREPGSHCNVSVP